MSIIKNLWDNKGAISGLVGAGLSPFTGKGARDAVRVAGLVAGLPNQVRSASDLYGLVNSVYSITTTIFPKTVDFINKLRRVTDAILPAEILGQVRVSDLQFDRNKVVPLIDRLYVVRNQRIAKEIESIYATTQDGGKIAKLIRKIDTSRKGIDWGDIFSLLPGQVIATFLPKYLEAYDKLDQSLGISNAIGDWVKRKMTKGEIPDNMENVEKDKYLKNPDASIFNPIMGINPLHAPMYGNDSISDLLERYAQEYKDKMKLNGINEEDIDQEDLKSYVSNKFISFNGSPPAPDNKKLEIKDIKVVGFDDYFTSNLGRLEFASSHLWNIDIEPYTKGVPEFINSSNLTILPITTWTLNNATTGSETLEMFGGSSISIPTNNRIEMSMNVTFIEDSRYSVKRWLEKYKKHMYPNSMNVTPYKECCSKITISILDWDKDSLFTQQYLGFPIDIDSNLEGDGDASVQTKSITFSIVGKIESTDIDVAIESLLKKEGRYRDSSDYVSQNEELAESHSRSRLGNSLSGELLRRDASNMRGIINSDPNSNKTDTSNKTSATHKSESNLPKMTRKEQRKLRRKLKKNNK